VVGRSARAWRWGSYGCLRMSCVFYNFFNIFSKELLSTVFAFRISQYSAVCFIYFIFQSSVDRTGQVGGVGSHKCSKMNSTTPPCLFPLIEQSQFKNLTSISQ
jgi:hypothetical protein